MEPTIQTLGGSGPGQVALRLFLSTRPKFFTGSILPVLVGSAWGYKVAGAFDPTTFVLAVLATALVNAAINVLNDVYDEETGNDAPNDDRIYPYTGGSRFIQNGVMNTAQMRQWGIALLVLCVVAGSLLVYLKGLVVLAFGFAGVGLGVLYSAPPIRLSARGLGELAVGIGCGPLPVAGAAWLQTGTLSIDAVVLSIPIGIWVANVLLINEVPDLDADRRSGCRTLAVRLGIAGTGWLYLVGQVAAATVAVGMGVTGLIPLWGGLLLTLTLLPAGMAARSVLGAEYDRGTLRTGIKATLLIHAVGSLALLGIVLFPH